MNLSSNLELIQHGRSIIRLMPNRQAPFISVSRLFHRIFGVSPGLLPGEFCLKVGMQADLEQRDERPAQFLERVTRERDERLKQLAKAAERPANPFVFEGTERRVSPLAVGGKAHQHAESVVRRNLDIRREMELPLLTRSFQEDHLAAVHLDPDLIPGQAVSGMDQRPDGRGTS